MLAVTGAAAEVIAGLVAELGSSKEGGLRVATAVDSPEKLALSLARTPVAGDRVVAAEGGVQVFLDSRATELLSGKVLDVRESAGGRLDFTLADQG
jgi:Fe-S cluster assembly iron-binding protein IscA